MRPKTADNDFSRKKDLNESCLLYTNYDVCLEIVKSISEKFIYPVFLNKDVNSPKFLNPHSAFRGMSCCGA